jgi:hypothetical protein
MLFSNVAMYFIMLAAATTLNREGIRLIESSRQAAEALRPLARQRRIMGEHRNSFWLLAFFATALV